MHPYHWFLLFLAQLAWSGSYVAMKWAGEEMHVGIVVFLRYGGASLGFFMWNFFSSWPRWNRKDLGLLTLLGLLTFALAPTLQILSLRYTRAIDVSILIALEPLMTALVAALVLKEKISRQTIFALIIATTGVLVLSGMNLHYAKDWVNIRLLGNLIFLMSLLFEVAVTVAGRQLGCHYRPKDAIQAMMLAGFLGSSLFYANQIVTMDFMAPSPRAWGSILYLIVGPSIFSYTVWYRVLRDVPASRVALSLFFQPLTGTFLGYFLLAERIGVETLLGGTLICGVLAWWQIRANANLVSAR